MTFGLKFTGNPCGTGSRSTAQLTTVGGGGDEAVGLALAVGDGWPAPTGAGCPDRSAYGPAMASPIAATRAIAPDAAAPRRTVARRRPVATTARTSTPVGGMSTVRSITQTS